MDVAIVGIGIHPFGRFPGVTGDQMGAVAVRAALADAGVAWKDIQFAYGGSMGATLGHQDVGSADTLVNDLGMTGLPFVNVANGCATAGSALSVAAHTIGAGAFDLGLAVGFDKHPRGHFNADAGTIGLPSWYGETGFMVTTQFFAMKLVRYMHEHGITAEHAREGRGEGLPQRLAEPQRVAPHAVHRGADPRVERC